MPPRVSSKADIAVLVANDRVTVLEMVLVENAAMCCFPAERRRAERVVSFMVELWKTIWSMERREVKVDLYLSRASSMTYAWSCYLLL